MSTNFNFKKALSELRSGKDLTGKDGVLMPLIKQPTEAALGSSMLEFNLINLFRRAILRSPEQP